MNFPGRWWGWGARQNVALEQIRPPPEGGCLDGWQTSGGAGQRRPGREGIHVVAPVHDLAVFDEGDRHEPVVVGEAGLEDPAVHLVFERHDATVTRRMHGQAVAAIEPDVAAIPGIERNEIVAAARYPRPARDFIAELK